MSHSRSLPLPLFLLFALAVALAGAASTDPADAAVSYRPPVDAPVVDGFRLPDGPYGPGNRGLEYATAPGTAVRAIGDGLVVFAGPVARTRHVTVLHADGLRSSYSYVAEVLVTAGERVVLGQTLATTGERLHLGVRAGGTYLDPAALFAPEGVRLVPLLSSNPNGSRDGTASPATRGVDQNGFEGVWDWLQGGAGAGGTGTLARRS